jgi:hypothetical protein
MSQMDADNVELTRTVNVCENGRGQLLKTLQLGKTLAEARLPVARVPK